MVLREGEERERGGEVDWMICPAISSSSVKIHLTFSTPAFQYTSVVPGWYSPCSGIHLSHQPHTAHQHEISTHRPSPMTPLM